MSHRVSVSCYLTSDRHEDGEMRWDASYWVFSSISFCMNESYCMFVSVCSCMNKMWVIVHSIVFCQFLHEQKLWVIGCSLLLIFVWMRHWTVTGHCSCINEWGEFSSVILFQVFLSLWWPSCFALRPVDMHMNNVFKFFTIAVFFGYIYNMTWCRIH